MPRVATTRTIRRDQVPSAFTLQAWFAGNGTHSQNGGIDYWFDASAAGHSASQATAANRMTQNDADSGYNNQPTVTTNADRKASTGTWGVALAQPFTVYVVGEAGSNANYRAYFGDVTSGNGPLLIADITTGFIYMQAQAAKVINSGIVGSSTKKAICAVFNGASSGLYVNSATAGTTGDAGNGSLAGLVIGDYSALNLPLNGKLAEVVICSGAHNATTRGLIMAYLGTKFTITIA